MADQEFDDFEHIHLSEDEIALIEGYKEIINQQTMAISVVPGTTHQAHLIAELCILHFKLGRKYEWQKWMAERT